MFKRTLSLMLPLLLSASLSFANNPDAKSPKPKKEAPKEETVTTNSVVTINGEKVPYTATAGTIVYEDAKGDAKASFFYTAYVREGIEDKSDRPITFCFNGGPGSSSVWLHMGVFGPKRIVYKDKEVAAPPYHLQDNEYSLLDVTDLVFIDPVSTGYSRSAPEEDPKQFHGVDEDIKSVADFIRLYSTKNERWDSPKFLAGESYGTTRAAGLAAELHDETFMYVNGLILVSSVLDFQTLKSFEKGNDLPYMLLLPSYTMAAIYHDKLDSALQNNPEKARKEAEDFAMNEYALALLKGDVLDPETRKSVIDKLHALTGISKEYIDNADLRVNPFQFRKELLKGEKRCIGRFDTRYEGIETRPFCEYALTDPSLEAVLGVFTATFNQYVRHDLGWKQNQKYEILANVQPWNYGSATNEYLNVASSLREVMSKNPKLEVFVGNGYYDLATPYYATEYTFNHLNLDASLKGNVTMDYYDAGHMMYIHEPSLVKLSRDIKGFVKKILSKN